MKAEAEDTNLKGVGYWSMISGKPYGDICLIVFKLSRLARLGKLELEA